MLRVHFRTSRLRRCFEEAAEAARTWGAPVGQRYRMRVRQIQAATQIDDLYAYKSLAFHPLKGRRQGEYALTILARWRLILTVGPDDAVTIEEVSNHYDD